MKKILILIIFVLIISFVSGQNDTEIKCEQTSSGCCKGDICEEASVVCEKGYVSTFGGCNEECRPIVECVKDYFVCEDSDNGKNYYEQGKVYYGDEFVIDICEDETILREYFCSNDGVDSVEYKCPFGCKDDACLKEEECTLGGYQCNGALIQKCDYATGKWFDFDYCNYGCRDGECIELKEGSSKYFMNVGDVINFNGRKIKLIDVIKEGNSIIIEVDDVREYISDREVVYGIDIIVLETFYGPELTDKSATIAVYSETDLDNKPNLPIDLSNYPKMLIKEDKFLAYIVVGDMAPASDSIAAVDIATGIQYSSAYTNTEMAALTKLASEIQDPFRVNIISIGNPCNNKISYKLMGTPYTCLKGFTKGEGIIRLYNYNGYAQILVAGYSDQDTRKAAKILANWKDYNLRGKEIRVIGDFNNPVVNQGNLTIEPIINNTLESSVSSDGEQGGEIVINPVPILPQSCNGCFKNSDCLPFGTRVMSNGVAEFCDVNKEFVLQKEKDDFCQNNYECKTNQCSNSKCMDLEEELRETRGLMQEILEFLKRIFG